MADEESTATFVGALSRLVGASEPALRLLLTILAGYPLALLHRNFVYGRPANQQHLFFIATGFTLGYLNYGFDMFHSMFAIVFSFLTMVIFRGSETSVAITFLFNMIYLLTGYYYTSTNDYDINWTMPHCVLVLRLIGLSFDVYDGTQPEEELSAKSKELALRQRPTFIEYCGNMLFPASFLIGPQFPMKRYRDFVSGEFSEDPEEKEAPPQCIEPALRRFSLGVMYLAIFQVVGSYVSDEYILSEDLAESSFLKKYFILGVWGRICLYKYISCWLLTEGACIMFGLTHNGKTEEGETKWDGLANVDIVRLETATEFNHYILAFNCNTNAWIAQYIYKRLKFMNNKLVSQGASLLFLALWHGFHSGYYICFLFEFIVMYMEKDFQSILARYPHFAEYFKSPVMTVLCYVILRIYTFVLMGWCLLPFALLTVGKYWQAFGVFNYIGIIVFVPWPFLYAHIVRQVAKATQPIEHEE